MMGWILFVVLGIVGLYFVYRALSGGVREASKIIGYSLNIKSTFVTDCIAVMRSDPNRALGNASRQRYFCDSVISAHGNIEELSPYVKTFYVYQILKNNHEANVKWWSDRLKASGFSPEITRQECNVFEMFFDVEHSSFQEFVSAHNKMLLEQKNPA